MMKFFRKHHNYLKSIITHCALFKENNFTPTVNESTRSKFQKTSAFLTVSLAKRKVTGSQYILSYIIWEVEEFKEHWLITKLKAKYS